MTQGGHVASAFGLVWRSDVPLDGFAQVSEETGGPEVRVSRVSQLSERIGGSAINRGSVHDDGFRFVWNDEVVFDMSDGDRIAYCPGAGWRGRLPACFYSTVAALTVAWRGMLPLHACTVEIGGRAVLIAGRAGTGKSTLTAELIARGAHFVADDLSVVTFGGDGDFRVPCGRPTMRLHRDTASGLAARRAQPVADDPRGKWLVWPTRRYASAPLRPGVIVLLGEEPWRGGTGDVARLIPHLFRPHWLAALPDHGRRIGKLALLAEETPLLACSALNDGSDTARRNHAKAALTLIEQALIRGVTAC